MGHILYEVQKGFLNYIQQIRRGCAFIGGDRVHEARFGLGTQSAGPCIQSGFLACLPQVMIKCGKCNLHSQRFLPM